MNFVQYLGIAVVLLSSATLAIGICMIAGITE